MDSIKTALDKGLITKSESLNLRAFMLYNAEESAQTFLEEFTREELETLRDDYCMLSQDGYAAAYDDEVFDALWMLDNS